MESWKTSVILLGASLAVTLLLWWIGLPFFFLFIPILPFLDRREEIRRCPVCGWETAGSERYCPYDATPLETPKGGIPGKDR